jgi:hypothetical protein
LPDQAFVPATGGKSLFEVEIRPVHGHVASTGSDQDLASRLFQFGFLQGRHGYEDFHPAPPYLSQGYDDPASSPLENTPEVQNHYTRPGPGRQSSAGNFEKSCSKIAREGTKYMEVNAL